MILKTLWAKFLILLLTVSLIGLSAAFYMRLVMLSDFRAYLEGERFDHAYHLMASLEGGYEQWSGWDDRHVRREVIRALMLGMVTRVLDNTGEVLVDSAGAVNSLPPLMKRRVLSLVDMDGRVSSDEFIAYPLFLAGEKIGILEVKYFPRERADLFAKRSMRFLFIAFVTMGGLSVVASIVFSRRLTLPVRRLEEQTRSIREGDLSGRVDHSGVDEIGKLSRAFNEMVDDLELQETLRRKLIANVAHELRTPLAAMTAELEAMADGILPTDMERVRSLLEEAGRLRTMLDGIDDLTQAQASSLSLSLQNVSLRQILKNMEDRFRAQAGEKGITFDVPDQDLIVHADPDRLSQILINLVSNSLRAVPEGGRISFDFGLERDEVYIEVYDSGPGIPEDVLPHVFERFYSGTGGLGLGMTIVKELAEAHGGEVKVESESGKGTRVRVALPSDPGKGT